jgi:NMD protein affecting ribosome stability and mRNA decay
MSTGSTTKQVAPLACTRCGNEDGPLVLTTGLCEDCEPEVASALRGTTEAAA